MNLGGVEVGYKPKAWPSEKPLYFVGAPAKLAAARLSASDRQRQELTSEQYQLDPRRHIITVRLIPGEALRVASLGD